ncbi:MAG: RecX family transcriptional regulator [Paludibacteraceae bacterium]|nr:RecX family transcriptional regulator [Paludibacteraceae bacterium]
MKNQEWSPAELKSKLEAYCAAAEHCESDARMRLRHWNCDSQTEDSIIDQLIEQNYISDERYAKAFVHDKLLYQGWGRVKIAYMLRAKKIAPQIIQSALETIDETEYFRILSHLISQRVKSKKELTREELASLYRFLTQRGFTMEEIIGAGLSL